MFLELLNAHVGESLDAKGREYQCYITEAVTKMESMLEGLVQYSRLNTMAKEFCAISCNQVLQNAKEVFGKELEKTGGRLEWQDLPRISGDIDQILQMFCLMIENAIRFSDPNRPLQIRIEVERCEEMWLFSVRDNGIGIPEPLQEKIFLPLRKGFPEKYPAGSGMGLAMVKKIVERHGGMVWCDSVEGKGSVFYFSLPVLVEDRLLHSMAKAG